MIGAIIGDIVGSVYEWNNIKTKEFPLFRDDCFFTDDTVMTIATADALMDGGTREDFVRAYQKWGTRYPDAGYGGMFGQWIYEKDPQPYNSWGNGSAMRVAPCAWWAIGNYVDGDRPESIISTACQLAQKSAQVTHNHPQGVKGAEAVAYAMAICYGYPPNIAKTVIRKEISAGFGYDLSQTLDEIRPNYQFHESCRDTVPQAIVAFLESVDFEDAIRNAISLGGDSDTLAAITGSIAEVAYGVPTWIAEKARSYLDDTLLETLDRWPGFSLPR